MWEDVESYLTGQDIYVTRPIPTQDLGAVDITEIIKIHRPIKYCLVPIPRGKNRRKAANIRSLPLDSQGTSMQYWAAMPFRETLKLDSNQP